MSSIAAVTIRRDTPDDAAAVRALSALDSRRPPRGPLLLAEVDGVLHAAVAVADGDAIADPFRPTADTVELLRLRARSLRADAPAPSRPAWRTRRPRATSPA